jgi:hypothetical protein
MKMKSAAWLIFTVVLFIFAACKESGSNTPEIQPGSPDAAILSMKIARFPVTLGTSGGNADSAEEGAVTIKGPWANTAVPAPKIQVVHTPNAALEYAVGGGAFSVAQPDSLTDGSILWVKVTGANNTSVSYYKIKVAVQTSSEGYGVKDPAWAADAYNAKYRIFPNAPEYGILSYDDINTNAPPTYWNAQGHNHKYPDLFHFANGNKVETLADWENRRTEIFNILQYYMHGRMPSIDSDVLKIAWQEMENNTCRIRLLHIPSNRAATITVTHTPPTGAAANAKDKILLFGVGMAPNGSRHPGWGIATFDTTWGGSESNRSGTCATLYGLSPSNADTPSVNMEYAWAMSVILTVIEQGGLGGYYDPAKIGVYGFSRWGKAALCIGAFAESRGGAQLGFTFVGSSGSGGAALDRWIAPFAYKDFEEDPLPVDGEGAKARSDLRGTTWFYNKIEDDHNAGNEAIIAVRGWEATTPGIPDGSRIYGEYNPNAEGSFTRRMGLVSTDGWYQIQPLVQARGETQGWFSARFMSLTDLHNGLALDNGNPGGVLCTMPFDSHFITALVAPRIIYYQDGYNCLRTNPESQWANWLICDEIYQLYAEELNDPSIIQRNNVKFYDIEHTHRAYQDQDEYDLVTALYSGQTPNLKFRTTQFPVDDPRYRWDFDRMDFGRSGHPAIAERVRLMRTSTVKVKAMDARGLLDVPEPLN